MVSKGYNNILVCTSPSAMGTVTPIANEHQLTLCFLIRTADDVDVLKKSREELLSLSQGQFCLWFDEMILREKAPDLNNLSLLFYSTRYLFRYGGPVVFLSGCKTDHSNESQTPLEWISGLGFNPCVEEVGRSPAGIENNDWFLNVSENVFDKQKWSDFYRSQLAGHFFVGRDIFLFPTGSEQLIEMLEMICSTEKGIQDSNPELHEVFLRYRYLLSEHEILTNENRRLEIDLGNQKKYLAVLRKEKEMERIIEFYHREYEVLPLWYKRFGHVIKIMTGKRKWRSNHETK